MPEEDDGTVTRLTAFVVAPGLASETVMAALRQRIDPASFPRPLCFVESLPRNETGKLSRVAVEGPGHPTRGQSGVMSTWPIIPLICNFEASAVFAFRNRRPIRVEDFSRGPATGRFAS